MLGFHPLSTAPLSSLSVSSSGNALALVSLTPTEVWEDGGEVLELIGAFTDSPMEIVIVVSGIEYPCYSGVSGQAYGPIPIDDTTVRFIAPRLPAGGPYDLTARQDGSESTLPAVLTVRNMFFRSRIFNLRQLAPPLLRAGARRLDMEPPL